jgi:hypothetical protein
MELRELELFGELRQVAAGLSSSRPIQGSAPADQRHDPPHISLFRDLLKLAADWKVPVPNDVRLAEHLSPLGESDTSIKVRGTSKEKREVRRRRKLIAHTEKDIRKGMGLDPNSTEWNGEV